MDESANRSDSDNVFSNTSAPLCRRYLRERNQHHTKVLRDGRQERAENREGEIALETPTKSFSLGRMGHLFISAF